ncbi:MFS transporter [Streptomyces sp. NPDC050610]|uniref:MFS transporter n=1 Tax=Streptomyces sp. NPDC050610 TaxID=3157097 RepID=UPI003424DC9D
MRGRPRCPLAVGVPLPYAPTSCPRTGNEPVRRRRSLAALDVEKKSDTPQGVLPVGPAPTSFSWSYWSRFALVYCCGILTAMSLGKMAPIAVELRGALGLSLDQMSLVTSATTAVAALFGIPMSYLLVRFPLRWALVTGCLVMAVAGFLGSRTGHFGSMMATRLVESLGYVAVVVAAPAVIIAMGGGVRRITALAVWGTFFPVGLALGLFAGGLLSAWFSWRTWLAIAAAALLAMGVVTAVVLGRPARVDGDGIESADASGSAEDRSGPAGERSPRRLARPLLLALGFATASGSIVAVVSLLPTYLHEELSVSTAEAGTLTGGVSLVGTVGGFLSGWMLRRGVPVRRVFATSLLMPVGTAIAFLSSAGVAMSAVGAMIVAIANEMVVAAVFATIPTVVRTPADIGITNGLVAQVGSVGSLAGPPLASFAVLAADGWWAVVPTVLLVCAVGTVLLRVSVRRLSA